MSTTTMALREPRITAWPCRIIISMVTPTVLGRPWTTMPSESPTSSTSHDSSSAAAIGAV
jgi:hypothetical protein